MLINYKTIDHNLEINKQQIHNKLQPKTVKEDKTYTNRIEPFISVNIAQNFILQNSKLEKCIRVLSQDTILNDFNFKTENNEINKQVMDFWRTNLNELYKQIQEYYSYGFGASEIIFDETGNPIKLYQIPAETLYIKQERNNNGEYSYYAIQEVVGEKKVKMRLSRFQYGHEDDDLPLCFWIGGGKTSDFYEIPYWLPAFNSISAKIALDGLNYKKINEGNLNSGILLIRRPPSTQEEKDKTKNDLKDQMDDAGTGILTLDLESFNPQLPLEAEYIPITENNYDYLSKLAKDADDDVLACYSIPKVRLMIDDVTESMNSNKSDTIYEIYTKSLENEQLIFEIEINNFNEKYFNYFADVDIKTPLFSDKKDIEIGTLLNLFDKGILTLGQIINGISKYFPELELDYDINNPVYHERYYNGKILGMDEYDTQDEIESAGDLFAYLK